MEERFCEQTYSRMRSQLIPSFGILKPAHRLHKIRGPRADLVLIDEERTKKEKRKNDGKRGERKTNYLPVGHLPALERKHTQPYNVLLSGFHNIGSHRELHHRNFTLSPCIFVFILLFELRSLRQSWMCLFKRLMYQTIANTAGGATIENCIWVRPPSF